MNMPCAHMTTLELEEVRPRYPHFRRRPRRTETYQDCTCMDYQPVPDDPEQLCDCTHTLEDHGLSS